MEREQIKTGVELVLTLQLAIEIMEEYKLTGRIKKYGNMFKRELDTHISRAYDRIYATDPTIVTNGMNIKHKMLSQFAELGEDDAMLVAQKLSDMIDNIEELRKQAVMVVDINSDDSE
jgi:hypothetical protein